MIFYCLVILPIVELFIFLNKSDRITTVSL